MNTQTHTTPIRVRAFTLLEILLAIFILGIGVISIASLFPAGIAQQRLSNDDSIAPLVADNAIEIIRSKVKLDDFGTFEEFTTAKKPPLATIPGDWTWIRPAVLTMDDPATTNGFGQSVDDIGAMDLFAAYKINKPGVKSKSEFEKAPFVGPGNFRLYGMPYNKIKYGKRPPMTLITQQERYYPMASKAYVPYESAEQPQYMWDCMFRRFQGKILVAIFVYRANLPGGGNAANLIASSNTLLPVRLELGGSHTSARWNAELGTLPPTGGGGGPTGPGGPPVGPSNQTGPGPGGPPPHDSGTPSNQTGSLLNPILGLQSDPIFDPDDFTQAWQEPRQWILDQNNNIHRVAGVSREGNGKPNRIELVRPVAAMPVLPAFYLPGNPKDSNSVVDTIWYMPLSIKGVSITPVYVTVKEL